MRKPACQEGQNRWVVAPRMRGATDIGWASGGRTLELLLELSVEVAVGEVRREHVRDTRAGEPTCVLRREDRDVERVGGRRAEPHGPVALERLELHVGGAIEVAELLRRRGAVVELL
jgi:hypothetical protein